LIIDITGWSAALPAADRFVGCFTSKKDYGIGLLNQRISSISANVKNTPGEILKLWHVLT
jgi:hypothetical protein